MKKNNSLKISYNLLTLLLIATAFLGVSFSYGDVYLFHIVLFFVWVFWLSIFKKNNFKLDLNFFLKKKISTFILIFCWYLVSLLWAPNLILGLKYLFYLFSGFTVFVSIVFYSNNLNKLSRVYNLISGLILIEIIIGLLESFGLLRMPISSFSSVAHIFAKDPVDLYRFDSFLLYSNFKPPTALRWNTNDFAICMSIALPFVLCKENLFIKISLTLIIIALVIMTASRAVFLSSLFTIFLYLFLIKKQIGTLFIVLTSIVFLILGMSFMSESQNPRFNEVANSLNALGMYISGDIDVGGSLEWRRELVSNGINAFKKTLGFGLGSGGSTAMQEIQGPVAGRFTSMHNFWIELLVEGGIFSAALLTTWITAIIYNLFIFSRSIKCKKLKYYCQSSFLAICSFIPAAVAASSTIYFFPMWILFGFSNATVLLSAKKCNHLNLLNNTVIKAFK